MNMAISFRVLDGDGFLRIVSTGLCEDLDQLKEYVLAMHKATISSGQIRVLVDETGVAYRLATVDDYHSGCFASQLAPQPLKIAVLCSPEGWSNAKFWETVAVNRGVPVRVFRDQNSAEAWVRS
jgi:hypothetical protein